MRDGIVGLVRAALAAAAMTAPAFAESGVAPPERPVVLELFVSQNCGACMTANAALVARATLEAVREKFQRAKYAGIACGLKNTGIGNGMPDEEAQGVRIKDMDAFREYQEAVWSQTEAYLSSITADDLAWLSTFLP